MDDETARNRHLLIGVTRIAGAILVVLGLMAVLGRIDLDPIAGWVLLIAGLAGFFFAPLYLLRRWRTPKP